MKNILVVSTTGMGDCLWGTPFLRALKKSFPEVKIDVLVNAKWKSLLDNNPHIDRLMSYSHHWYRRIPLGIRLMLNPFRYDAVLIFHGNRSFRRLLPFIRYSTILFHQSFDWIPHGHRIRFNEPTHGMQRRLAVLEKIGTSPDGMQMEIFLDATDHAKTTKYLNQIRVSPGDYIYLNIGASLDHKRWPMERLIELAKIILKNTLMKIILGGGPEDKERSKYIKNHLDSSRIAEACGQPIRANADLIAQARLMVTTDTGPMHIAFAMKTPTVALFGPTRAVESGPYEIPETLCRVIESMRGGTTPPEGNESIDYYFAPITVEVVWRQIQELLATHINVRSS